MIQFYLKVEGLSSLEQTLNPDIINKAITRALNRAAKSAVVIGSRKIREIYNIKAVDIKKAVKIRKATLRNTEAELQITGEPIPFKYFGAKQTRKGVTVRIKKTEPRKLIRSAFIGGYLPIKQKKGKYKPIKRVSWGGGHVYKRQGKKWLPISKLVATHITIPDLFRSPKIWPNIQRKIHETFQKEFWRNYEYYLSKK